MTALRFSHTIAAVAQAVLFSTVLSACGSPRLDRFALHEERARVYASRHVDVCVGDTHTVVLRGTGRLQGWGSNALGQIDVKKGAGPFLSPIFIDFPPKVYVFPSPPADVATLACNTARTGASGAHGPHALWGYVSKGDPLVSAPFSVAASGPHALVSISIGRHHECANVGDVFCRGEGDDGRLGNGSSKDVDGAASWNLAAVSSVAAGGAHTCAATGIDPSTGKGGEVWCAGSNAKGQLGSPGAGTKSTVPIRVPGLPPATIVAAGDDHTCALTGDQLVFCWGSRVAGQLGNGNLNNPDTTSSTTIPVAVTGLSQVKAISAQGNSTCALRTDGSLWCWGDNTHGQLARDPLTAPRIPAPQEVLGVPPAYKIAVGRTHSCAITSGSPTGLWCWGRNGNGMLTNGTLTDSFVPVTHP